MKTRSMTTAIPSIPALGSPIDRVDKFLSLFVYNRSLHFWTLEFLLSIIGHQHGIPITSMALHCVTLAAINDYAIDSSLTSPLLTISAALTLLQLLCWTYAILNHCHEKFYTVSKGVLASSIIASHLTVYHLSPHSTNVASHYFLSYLSTQSIVVALKMYCVRMRPAHALKETLAPIPRLIPRVTFRGAKGWTVFESFPSGDAAGGACFSVVLAGITGSNWAYLIAAIVCYGRMYLFAHHLLDVAVGCAIAYVVTTLLGRFGESLTITYVFVSIPFFMAYFSKVLKMRRMELPEEFTSAGHSVASWGHESKSKEK